MTMTITIGWWDVLSILSVGVIVGLIASHRKWPTWKLLGASLAGSFVLMVAHELLH